MTKKLTNALMCQPDFFQVEYVINPWMKLGSVDGQAASEQWQKLKQTLELLSVKVNVISQAQELPDMVFAADQGIVRGKQALLGNFAHAPRQGETAQYQTWLRANGYQTQTITSGLFEGGEYLPWQQGFFIGTGFRTTPDVIPELEQFLTATITPLELIDDRFYHLDTCLLPLDQETVFYYPAAFSLKSQKTLQKNVPHLIELTQDEALNFGANSVVIGKRVLMSGFNPTLAKKVTKLGYEPIELDVSEFIKAGGGIHCLVLPLAYEES